MTKKVQFYIHFWELFVKDSWWEQLHILKYGSATEQSKLLTEM